MNRPVHFEILANNPQKIVAFYKGVFDWQIDTWGGDEQSYWLVTTGPDEVAGINGGIMARQFEQAVINTMEVKSLEAMIRKVEAAGGRKILGPNEIPGVGTHAYCSDPEGNLFGILEPAPASE